MSWCHHMCVFVIKLWMYVLSCVCWSSDHGCLGVGLLTLGVLVWLCVFVVFGVCLRSVLVCWSSDRECCEGAGWK